jgi:2-oxo-3-hexenedioate decarboxylase
MTGNALGAFIASQRQKKQIIDAFPDELRPRSEIDAIRAGLAQTGHTPPGWKLGGTNALTRDMFKVPRAYFGPLKAEEIIVAEDACIMLADLIAPKVEPEICVAFDADLDPQVHGGDIPALRGLLAYVTLGLEIPDTVLRAPPEAGVHSLIADRCAAGRLVLGPRLPASALETLEALPVVMTGADGTRSQGHGDWLIGGALAGVSEMLETLRGIVDRIPAGTPVATGGLAKALPLGAGITRFDAGPHTLAVRAV